MAKGIIIGGGHNGLVTACYLAEAGHDIQIFEARSIVGGAAVTEEFHPGFRNSTASYTVSLLHPQVIQDLKLHDHGLQILERPVSNFLPLNDGRYLALHPDLEKTKASLRQFSEKDADNLERYFHDLGEIVPVIQWVMTQIPPKVSDGGLGDLIKAIQLSSRFSNLSSAAKTRLLKLFSLSAAEFLAEYFESEPITAVFGFDAVVGHFESPYSPGSAYVLLHHVVGGVNGKTGNWGHAAGGMGAISQAMAKQAESLGVEIHLHSPVSGVLTSRGKASGIQLEDGSQIAADFIAANVNPALLFRSMLPDESVPQEITQHFAHYKNQSGTFRLNVALSHLPEFTCQPDPQALAGGIIMAPSLKYMEEAFYSSKQNAIADKPIVEMLIPSLLDDSLAPPDQHVASLFCQHFDPKLGSSWDSHKDQAINAIFDVVESHAPGFRKSVIAIQSHSPWDLEKKFGLTGGDIFHGRLSLEQLFSARPMFGMGQYQTHLPNVFMCGSGTHPGGGVSGIPGMNAAKQILKKL